jgi:hypothetical protein
MDLGRCVRDSLIAGYVLLLIGGCAARREAQQTQLVLHDADALVARGCYRCLTDALARYDSIEPCAVRLRQTLVERRFRTLVLLGLRERERDCPEFRV